MLGGKKLCLKHIVRTFLLQDVGEMQACVSLSEMLHIARREHLQYYLIYKLYLAREISRVENNWTLGDYLGEIGFFILTLP